MCEYIVFNKKYERRSLPLCYDVIAFGCGSVHVQLLIQVWTSACESVFSSTSIIIHYNLIHKLLHALLHGVIAATYSYSSFSPMLKLWCWRWTLHLDCQDRHPQHRPTPHEPHLSSCPQLCLESGWSMSLALQRTSRAIAATSDP